MRVTTAFLALAGLNPQTVSLALFARLEVTALKVLHPRLLVTPVTTTPSRALKQLPIAPSACQATIAKGPTTPNRLDCALQATTASLEPPLRP